MFFSIDVNWVNTLQLSLYFYVANKCDPNENSKLEWRVEYHVEDTTESLDYAVINNLLVTGNFVQINGNQYYLEIVLLVVI